MEGNARAQTSPSALRGGSEGNPMNYAGARRQLVGLAAAQGDADAQVGLGTMHYFGEAGPVDHAEARRLYGLAAAQGHAEAQRMLGNMHCHGESGPVDQAEARRLYGLAAAQGHARAQCNLATMHFGGLGGPVNCAAARRLYGLAAAQGDACAQYSLGVMHSDDKCGPVDHAEARRLFGLAAAQGDAKAQCELGGMHYWGKGGPVDHATARRMLGLAAAQGNAKAQRNLGTMHTRGEGGPVDHAEARRLYGLAAAQGFAEAQCNLGFMHQNGQAGPVDHIEARRLFGLAAAQGDAFAQHNLGCMHRDGQGGSVDHIEARRLFGLAAAWGHAFSQYSLACMHHDGQGRPVDHVEARRLYGLAAAQGRADAQYNLGIMHARGEGGPADRAEAQRLFSLAAAQGDREAQDALEELEWRANAAADALLAELEAEKASDRKPKSRKSKARAKVTFADGGTLPPAPPPQENAASSKGPDNRTNTEPGTASGDGALASFDCSVAADEALRQAIAADEYEALSAALAAHSATASQAVLAAARERRDKLKDRRKKQSQRQRRAHAGGMQALEALRLACQQPDEASLRAALSHAEQHVAALPALEEEMAAARAMLESLGHSARPADASDASLTGLETAPPPSSTVETGAIELDAETLTAATDGFAEGRVVGAGGFGKVYVADKIAALPAHRRLQRLAVKRASAGLLQLDDVRQEVQILQACEHAHLLPLFGYCIGATSACLVFPLMVGGSLQTRLDLSPRDVAYLQTMGHFADAPKRLTWRQKLCAVTQSLEALVYLHTRTPQVLHRDFKPANILLDETLHAYLGDTGFAKAAYRSGDPSAMHRSTTGRIMGSPGYAHMDVISGEYSEFTEGYAVGKTLLVLLTKREPKDIEEMIEEDHEDKPFADIPAASLAEPDAGWPVEAAGALKEIYTGLCIVRKKKQLKLVDVLARLRAILQTGGDARPMSSVLHPAATVAVVRSSPLSVQLRGMRRAEDGKQLSVQRNVSEAFHLFIHRLDKLYESASAEAPADFWARIDYWRDECSLAPDIHARMHKLRIWRNASEHHDEQRWACDGPRSAEEASQLIEELGSML